MKKITLTLAAVALVFATACKKEVTETTTMDGDTTVTTETEVTGVDDTAWEQTKADAKQRWEEAEAKVKEAAAKGDKKAEEAARKVADEAKAAWDRLEAGAENAAAKTDAAMDKAAQDAKEGYNNALEKAKID